MTAYDALLGTISKDGVPIELGSGQNFTGAGVTITRNTATGKLDIAIPGGGGGSGGGGMGFAFTYSTSTADADPGTATFRANDAALASATSLYVDLTEFGGTDVTAWLDSLDDYGGGAINGIVRLSSQSDPTKWIEYAMTAWTAATGYRKLTVAYKAGPGGLLTTAGDTFFAFDYAGASTAGTAPQAAILIAGTADSHSGLAARDGVTPVDGTIIYDVGHATTASRGYWVARSGAWTRPSYYDADADVAALLGALVYITSGTLGGATSWQQLTGTTIAGAKTFQQFLGNPDTAVGENGSVTELGHDEGTGTGRLYSGARYVKDIGTTISAGATETVWSFDGAALGLSAGDLEAHSPNVLAWWATDSKSFWGTKALLAVHGTPPVLTDTKAQVALDTAGGGAGAYLTLAWDLSGNVIRLRATNNRASACSVVVTNNYLCAQMV